MPFLTQIGQKFDLTSFKFEISSYNWHNLHSGSFIITTFCFKRYSASKIWKKTNHNACLFTFFTTLDLIWPKFYPNNTPALIFLLVSNEIMLRNLINIKTWNPAVLEKFLLKPLKITIFRPNLSKKKGPHCHAQNKKNNFFQK